jgi:hypothetical protein
MNTEEKYFLNVAGEYPVCSELAKRNITANLTLGNKKAIDIIVINQENKAVTIEVKTSNKNKIVTGFFQKYTSPEMPHPDFWIFVLIDKLLNSRFFILTHVELAELQMKINKMNKWEHLKGVDNLPLKSFEDFENKWDKII